MEQNNKQTMPCFELGNLYVFKEEDEDGELTIIGKLIAKNEMMGFPLMWTALPFLSPSGDKNP